MFLSLYSPPKYHSSPRIPWCSVSLRFCCSPAWNSLPFLPENFFKDYLLYNIFNHHPIFTCWFARSSTIHGFPMAQLVRNPPAMRETWVQSLGWEDPPGKGKGYPFQYSGQPVFGELLQRRGSAVACCRDGCTSSSSPKKCPLVWALLEVTIVFQSLSYIWLLAILWTAACQASLSFTISWSFSNSCPLS